MAHAQQQILDALQALLAAGGTDAADRVFVDRVDVVPAALLPAILIDEGPEGETATPSTIHGVDERDLIVTVKSVVKDGANAASEARELGLQVEKIVAVPAAWAALAKRGVRLERSQIVNDGKGTFLLSERLQTWRFGYFVKRTTPDTIF